MGSKPHPHPPLFGAGSPRGTRWWRSSGTVGPRTANTCWPPPRTEPVHGGAVGDEVVDLQGGHRDHASCGLEERRSLPGGPPSTVVPHADIRRIRSEPRRRQGCPPAGASKPPTSTGSRARRTARRLASEAHLRAQIKGPSSRWGSSIGGQGRCGRECRPRAACWGAEQGLAAEAAAVSEEATSSCASRTPHPTLGRAARRRTRSSRSASIPTGTASTSGSALGARSAVRHLDNDAPSRSVMFRCSVARHLARALPQYALDRNADAFEGVRRRWSRARPHPTGQLPKFADDAYWVERDDLWAIHGRGPAHLDPPR